MPLNKHFNGHGVEVMAAMKRQYKDPKVAERVFYATENKRKESAGRMNRNAAKGKNGH